MNDKQKKTLLELAAQTIKACLTNSPFPQPHSNDPLLNEHRGCFVTLKNQERLRGCIGQFISDRPLVELIVDMAKSSATSDPRFFDDVVTASELDQLDIDPESFFAVERSLEARSGVGGPARKTVERAVATEKADEGLPDRLSQRARRGRLALGFGG